MGKEWVSLQSLNHRYHPIVPSNSQVIALRYIVG
jgi:hypothetical protein